MKPSTILVADDETFFRRLYSDILKEDGYRIETVSNGKEALERILQGGVDIVLTDMVMPELSGLELLRRVRSLDNPPEIILATGHATLESAIQALKNGARDYLVKPFSPEELRHLIRVCLEQRRLLDENTLLKSQIRLFRRGQSLSSQLEVDRLASQALETLMDEVGGARGFAFLVSEKAVSRVIAPEGLKEYEAMALSDCISPYLEDLSGIRLLKGGQLSLDGKCPENTRTVCMFPLCFQKTLKGVLVLLNPSDRDFIHPIPSENLLFLSEQAALGFENAYRYQDARELVYADDLTGLYNHRYLQIVLDREILRAERYGQGFSVLFIDLDHFKNLNDKHGHLAGSAALREVARLLEFNVREVDLLFRYGGDEFTALLVETEARGAAVVAERIRRSIEGHTFLVEEGISCRLTATIGFAAFPDHAADKRKIIDLADRAMYHGKKDRNVTRGAWEVHQE